MNLYDLPIDIFYFMIKEEILNHTDIIKLCYTCRYFFLMRSSLIIILKNQLEYFRIQHNLDYKNPIPEKLKFFILNYVSKDLLFSPKLETILSIDNKQPNLMSTSICIEIVGKRYKHSLRLCGKIKINISKYRSNGFTLKFNGINITIITKKDNSKFQDLYSVTYRSINTKISIFKKETINYDLGLLSGTQTLIDKKK